MIKKAVAVASRAVHDVESNMLTLVLETSTRRGSLALFEGETLLESRAFQALRGHNSKIYGPLGELLSLLDGRSLDRLVVGTGPGSYTGVRIAIAIADALALSHGAALCALSSLVAGEQAAKRASEANRYWVVGDARRRTWYRAEVRNGQLSGPIVTEARSDWEQAVQGALDAEIPVYTFDSEAPYPGVGLDGPTAERLGALSHQMAPAPGPVEPSYLAAPYITKPKKLAREYPKR